MKAEQDRMASVEKRLAKVERERWILRGLLALCAAGLGVVMLTAAGGGADDRGGMGRFKQVDAGHYVLRDSDGTMRGWFGIAEGGPRLIFFDRAGQQRMGVGMTKQGDPALAVYDPGENPRFVLGMVEEWPGIVMRDPQGRKRVAIYSRDDWGSLYFYDKRETKRTGIGQFGEAAALNLCDDEGKDRAGLTTERRGSSLSFFDIGGTKRLGVGLKGKDEAALGFFDALGSPLVAMSSVESIPRLQMYGTNRVEAVLGFDVTNRTPHIRFIDSYGKPTWQAP